MMTRNACRTVAVVVCLLASGSSLHARQDAPSADNSEEIIRQILELRERLESLLEALPPELREEVERRWRARDAARSSPPSEAERAPLEEQLQPVEVAPGATAGPEPPVAPADESELTASRPSVPSCDTLAALDSNDDGVVSAADRYWRYLRLWIDDADDRLQESELESLYQLGIREIEVGLRSFRTSDGASGDVSTDRGIHLQLFGRSGSAGRTGELVIDAGRLARGGRDRLIDASGTVLDGHQPLRAGASIEAEDGSRMPLLCP